MELSHHAYEEAMNLPSAIPDGAIRFVVFLVQTRCDGSVDEKVVTVDARLNSSIRKLERGLRERYDLNDNDWDIRMHYRGMLLEPPHSLSSIGVGHGSLLACHVRAR
jgi:hypothetical protein